MYDARCSRFINVRSMKSVHDIVMRSSIWLQRRRIREMCVAEQMLFLGCAVATLAFESDSLWAICIPSTVETNGQQYFTESTFETLRFARDSHLQRLEPLYLFSAALTPLFLSVRSIFRTRKTE
jgi:hypothetical protein